MGSLFFAPRRWLNIKTINPFFWFPFSLVLISFLYLLDAHSICEPPFCCSWAATFDCRTRSKKIIIIKQSRLKKLFCVRNSLTKIKMMSFAPRSSLSHFRSPRMCFVFFSVCFYSGVKEIDTNFESDKCYWFMSRGVRKTNKRLIWITDWSWVMSSQRDSPIARQEETQALSPPHTREKNDTMRN